MEIEIPRRPELTPTQLMAELQLLFAEISLNEQRNELVRELDVAILRSTFSPQHVLELIIEKCLTRTAADHGQVALYRAGHLVVAASSEPERVGEELPLQNSLCGKAVIDRAEQHCPDVSLLPPDSYVRFHAETQSELILPIQSAHTARVLGVIDLERNAHGFFPPTAMAFAHLLAGEAAIAIEHARVWAGVKTLYEISNAVAAGTLTLEQSCKRILTTLLAGFDFEHGQILIRDGEGLLIVASSRQENIGLRPGPDSSICGRYLLAEQGRTHLIINDIERSDYRDVYLALLGSDGQKMKSEMIIPLVSEHGTLIGALNVESPHIDVFTDPDESFFGVVGNLLAGAISATSKDEQIKTANLAMAQLGIAAQSFLHHFGSSIGDAHGRLLELANHLSASDLRPLPSRKGVTPVEFIHGILESLGEASNVIADLSNSFHPAGSGFQFRNVDLVVIAKRLVAKCRTKYADAGITFSFESQHIDRQGTAVCRLTEKVNEVIENLIDNAVRAIREKPNLTEPGKVTVSVALNDTLNAQLRVSDNGVGITTDDRPHIFEFGFTTREKKDGQGIGLWFCQHYVIQVGGTMKFDSVEGHGSWFEIEFPTIGS